MRTRRSLSRPCPPPFTPQPRASSQNWKSATLPTNCPAAPVDRPSGNQHRRHPSPFPVGLLFPSVQRIATGLPSLPVQHTTPRSWMRQPHGDSRKPHSPRDLRRCRSPQPNRPNVRLLHCCTRFSVCRPPGDCHAATRHRPHDFDSGGSAALHPIGIKLSSSAVRSSGEGSRRER